MEEEGESCQARSEEAKIDGLLQETVWLKQSAVEEAEAAFQKLSLDEGASENEVTNSDIEQHSLDAAPLMLETVWLRQGYFEEAESMYQQVLACSVDSISPPPPTTPVKRHHAPDRRTHKKLKSDKGLDSKQAKLHSQILSLSKSADKIHKHLDDFEKTQKRKAQAVQDTMMRLNTAIEACQNRLGEELQQSTSQIVWFRSLLKDMDSVIEKTDNILQDKNSSQTKALSSFYQTMSERISKMDSNLNQCIETCSGLKAEVPKSEINKIVGEIGRLSLFKKKTGSGIFVQKQEVVSKMLKDLMTEKYNPGSGCSSVVSDMSMEANVSSSQSSDEKDKDEIVEPQTNGDKIKHKKGKNRSSGGMKAMAAENSCNNNVQSPTKPNHQQGGAKPKISPGSSKVTNGKESSSTPKKRNAQGSQSTPHRKQEVFKFKGANKSAPTSPFVQYSGILGPRPGPFGVSEMNQPFTPRFQNFSSGYGNSNFNFSQLQHQVHPMGLQNQGLNALGVNMPCNFSNAKSPMGRMMPEHAREISYGMPYPQTQMSANMLLSHQGNVEQQLNEISQKIQQMQLQATHDYQLQQLMHETQRLKHIVARKQHEQHQQRDHFQQQFEMLINAFVQQQQLQAQQQPQPKVAKSMPTHQQRMFLNKQYQLHQQHKKQKQQLNKSQHTRQDSTDSPNQVSSQKQSAKSSSAEKKSKHQNGSPGNQQGKSNGSAGGRVPNKNSRLVRKGLFNPFAQGDKHRAGVSSMVVLEALNCVVLVDIINSCLKLYDISSDGSSSNSLNHRLITRLDLPRPFYMARIGPETVALSRSGNLLTLIKVSKRRLEITKTLDTTCQYYGLAYLKPGQLACAAFKENQIDIITVTEDDEVETSVLKSNCLQPELLSSVVNHNLVIYLERKQDEGVFLTALNTSGAEIFMKLLDSKVESIWNITCCGDKIICSNKSSHKLKMFSCSGNALTELNCPGGTMKQPFAMASSNQGFLYVGNDGAWDETYKHFVTTEINVFAFA